MTIINARTKPFLAVAGGVVALLAIVSLTPAGEPRSRYRTPLVVDQTRIDVDQSANAIRFYVGGKQVALIDSNGFSN